MFMFVCHVQLKCISFSSLIHTVGKVKSSHSFKMGNFEKMKKPKTRIEKINTCKRNERTRADNTSVLVSDGI